MVRRKLIGKRCHRYVESAKPAVEISMLAESMNAIKNFQAWVTEDFSGVYHEFQRAHSIHFKVDAGKFSKMSPVDRTKEFLKHLTEIEVYPRYFVKMPCMCCGRGDGNVRNHVIGDANYLKKHLSRDGHVYVLKRDFKRNFDGKDVDDSMFWSYANFKWESAGHRSSSVTFRGFCENCDNRLFSAIDDGMIDEEGFFKQIYRSACSLYFRFFEQTVKECYITDVLQDLGLSKDGWSDIAIQSEYGDKDRKPVNSEFVKSQMLYGAYLKFRITKELQAGLDYGKDVVRVACWFVENPSIYCGVVFEHRRGGERFERVDRLYRKVDHIFDVVVVLPLERNKTAVLNVTLPLGTMGYVSLVEHLSGSKRPDIVLTEDILKGGLPTLCDLYMAPCFYESLPTEHLGLITDASKPSDLPNVSLFDGFRC